MKSLSSSQKQRRRGPSWGDLLRDFPIWLLNDVPEREPKFAYRALLVIIPVAAISIGFFVWCLVALSIWIALTAGIAVLALGFIAVLAAVNRIMFGKMPRHGDS
jgi:hypothetical protein